MLRQIIFQDDIKISRNDIASTYMRRMFESEPPGLCWNNDHNEPHGPQGSGPARLCKRNGGWLCFSMGVLHDNGITIQVLIQFQYSFIVCNCGYAEMMMNYDELWIVMLTWSQKAFQEDAATRPTIQLLLQTWQSKLVILHFAARYFLWPYAAS